MSCPVRADDQKALRSVDFTSTTRIHDWRNYVGDNTRRLWSTFTDEQRLAIALDADEMAGGEEWE